MSTDGRNADPSSMEWFVTPSGALLIRATDELEYPDTWMLCRNPREVIP